MSSGTKSVYAATGLVAIAGFAAALSPIGPAAAFLIFGTSFLQVLGSSAKLQGEINSEISRQQGICDQIKFSKDQLSKIQNALATVKSAQVNEQNIKQQIGDMSESISAEIKKLKSMKSNFKTKLLIQIIIYVVIVSVLCIIIFLKKDGN